MAHTFDPIMWEAEASNLFEFEANLPIEFQTIGRT